MSKTSRYSGRLTRLTRAAVGLSILVFSCELALTSAMGESVASATTGSALTIIEEGSVVTGGVPFTYPVGFTAAWAGESDPVTVSVGPGDLPPEETLLSVSADAPWDCAGTDIAEQTITCTYFPSSTIPAGTTVSFNVEAVMAPFSTVDNSTTYVEVTYAVATSADGNGEEICNLDVFPADTTPPTVTALSASPALAPLGSGTTLSATVADLESGGTDVVAADYNVNGGTWAPMSGSFGNSSVDVTATIPAPPSPVAETLCVKAEDDAGNWSDGTACTSFVVYDPSAGFVTGGGWITSPAGACQDLALCADAQGKGTFGFVSKYQKGATVPSGNTQYVFHDGNFNFASSSYQWLVVNQAGSNAQFKGAGTINGTGSFQFMIWATAGSPSTFRIQVTDLDSGTTVYDTNTQTLGGGSIIIHKS